MSGLRVMAEQCETCIFGTHSPVRAGRMRELRRQWMTRDTHQVCHQTGAWDPEDPDDEPTPFAEQAVCRGFFDNVFMGRGTGQLLRISERLGGFDFVTVEKL